MLSSWTRAARNNPVPHLVISIPASCTSKVNLVRPFTPCRQQRRNSSSKPSNPQNGDTNPLAAPSDVGSKKTLSTSGTQTKKRLAIRTNRQKLRDTMLEMPQTRQQSAATELPAVPSTKNLHPHDIHVASFFSIHRPISVTAPVPTNSSIKTFSSIFTPKPTGKSHPADVIYTLSSMVQNLEKATSQVKDQSTSPHNNQEYLEPLRAAVTQASPSNAESTHLDGQLHQGVAVDIHELSKRFQPFVPPPPPVPMPAVLSHTSQTNTDVYPTHNTYAETHNTAFRKLRPFLERMRERHMQWEEYMERSKGHIWRMISVKRQRKLKMKKHKYKKLMRRTRNLRRRLDRL